MISATRWFYERHSLLIIVFGGVVCGISSQITWLAGYSVHNAVEMQVVWFRIVSAAVLTPLVFLGVHGLSNRMFYPLVISQDRLARTSRLDALTYLVFLASVMGALGIRFKFILALMLLFCVGLKMLIVLYQRQGQDSDDDQFLLNRWWLTFLFLLSGFAALIYQIVWQRVLFTAYGVNIESVTIVVSIFMLGLGIGSLIGGYLSKRYSGRLPELFLACEISIGVFGLVSLSLIEFVAEMTLHESLLRVSVVIFGLLLVPTMLMGATLPILVGYLDRYNRNVGRSVGVLYLFNTFGSALAAYATAAIFFHRFGLQATVYIAVFGNFIVGLFVYGYCKSVVSRSSPAAETIPQAQPPVSKTPGTIQWLPILALSAAVGFLSLSQEIVWIRVLSFATASHPEVFAYVLAAFLMGVALGAWLGHKLCELLNIKPMNYIAAMLVAGAVIGWTSIPIINDLIAIDRAAGIQLAYVFIATIAFCLGGIFPILCHQVIPDQKNVGLPVSWIYFANIVGATIGPLVTGFILMDMFSLETIVLQVSIGCALLGYIVYLASRKAHRTSVVTASAATAALIAVFLVFQEPMYSQMLINLQFDKGCDEDEKPRSFKHEIQNRSGIITVCSSRDGDIVYGGGIYDGRFNVDPVNNSNSITRTYFIAALHDSPREVLEIGLSTGSWLRILTLHEGVERVDVVEINEGYLKLLQHYPENASAIKDPRVKIHIDDGRRWLNRNPHRKFDFVLMNTTYHWRSNITNLLSREFLQLVKAHLKPNGVVYFNTTGNQDIPYTASAVFKHVVMFANFVAASDRAFSEDADLRRRNLLKFKAGGKPIFLSSNAHERVLNHLIETPTPDLGPTFRKLNNLTLITDDNMRTEFSRNYAAIVKQEWTWASLARRMQ
jgi:spermidine synthase